MNVSGYNRFICKLLFSVCHNNKSSMMFHNLLLQTFVSLLNHIRDSLFYYLIYILILSLNRHVVHSFLFKQLLGYNSALIQSHCLLQWHLPALSKKEYSVFFINLKVEVLPIKLILSDVTFPTVFKDHISNSRIHSIYHNHKIIAVSIHITDVFPTEIPSIEAESYMPLSINTGFFQHEQQFGKIYYTSRILLKKRISLL